MVTICLSKNYDYWNNYNCLFTLVEHFLFTNMIVFGFGHDKKPLLKGTNKYKIGFQKIDLKQPDAYSKVKTELNKW